MTIAYWCVFIFIWFPLVTVLCAKLSAGNLIAANHDIRAYIETKQGVAKKLYNAHLNAIEIFAPFAISVVIAQSVGQLPQATIDHLAIAFLISRIIYAVVYALDLATLRSIVWFVGVLIITGFYILPLF